MHYLYEHAPPMNRPGHSHSGRQPSICQHTNRYTARAQGPITRSRERGRRERLNDGSVGGFGGEQNARKTKCVNRDAAVQVYMKTQSKDKTLSKAVAKESKSKQNPAVGGPSRLSRAGSRHQQQHPTMEHVHSAECACAWSLARVTTTDHHTIQRRHTVRLWTLPPEKDFVMRN